MHETILQTSAPAQGIPIKFITGVSVSLSSAVIAYYAREIYQDWDSRAEKLDELYQAFFGMENVGTMEGVVEIVEAHDSDIERQEEELKELKSEVDEVKRKKKELHERVENLVEKHKEREE